MAEVRKPPPLLHTQSALGALQTIFSKAEVVTYPKDTLVSRAC